MLTISGLRCTLPGSGFTLHVANFQLRKGEVVYVRGRSGSGKTTLFNLLTGVFESSIGASCRSEFPTIAYVMHETSLLPWLTVKQNTRTEESLREQPLASGYFLELCQEFGLDSDVLQRRAAKLSLGMRQRVEIAQALSLSPDLLVLDEATAGLDTEAKFAVMKRISNIVKSDGLAVLATSHQLGDVLRFADRVCSVENGLVNGEIVFGTSPDERLALSTEELLKLKEAGTVIAI